MNRKNKYTFALLALAVCLQQYNPCMAQDSTKKEMVLSVGYYMTGNKMIYLMARAKTKINTKFQPVPNASIQIYLDSVTDSRLISSVITNESGEAKAIIPPGLKSAWDLHSTHHFIGIAAANKDFDETKTETVSTKSKIEIDTSSDGDTKTIIVSVSAFVNNAWVPAKDVEMIAGISRLGSILSAGDEATYTTDSSGKVVIELKKTGLPGDEKGNYVLAARVDDNDTYGNLLIEKTVPWGVALKPDYGFFNQRTLWSTRFRTPPWLLFMAYSIVIGVWGTIIYLVLQIVKINKLGKAVEP